MVSPEAADTWNIKKIISSANAIELLNSFLNTSPPNFIGGHTLENIQMCTIEQRLGLLTADRMFLEIVHNEKIRPDLLELLQDLGLLSSFLQAESETIPAA